MHIKKPLGWYSTKLKGKTIEAWTGLGDNRELVVLRLGRRLTPENMGPSRQIKPIAFGSLSPNKRMHLTEMALSTEAAVELHKVLSKALRHEGVLTEGLGKPLMDRVTSFMSKVILVHMFSIYQKQLDRNLRVKIVKAPA